MLNLLLSNSAHGPSKRSCCYLRAPCAHKGQTALTGLHKCRPETPGTVPPAQEEVGPKVAAVSGPSAQHARRLTQGLICMQRTQGIRQHSQVWTNADFKQLKQSLQLGGGWGGGLKREEKWGPRGPGQLLSLDHQHSTLDVWSMALSACCALKGQAAVTGLH